MDLTKPVLAVLLAATFLPSAATGQQRPAPILDVSAGWTGFVDETWIHHGTVGASTRFYVTPKFSVGPEITYMVGPDTDRDLFVFGNASYEWPFLLQANRPRLAPYVLGGWGYMRHRSPYIRFVADSTAYAGGAGVRISIGNRVSAAPEFRLGSELDVRMSGVVSVRLGRR